MRITGIASIAAIVSALVGCGRVGFGAGPEPDAAQVCGPDVDPLIDPMNCGTCQHDCGGGACMDGRCQPVVLASGQGALRGIVVDATHVYWTGPGAVRRVVKTGGAVEDVATFSGTGFRMIAFEGYLYWVTRDSGLVARAPMAAGTGAEILETNQGDVGGVATNGTEVFWNTYPTAGKIYRGLIGGAQFSEVLSIPSDDLTGMRLVGEELIYIQIGDGLMRIAAAGGGTPAVIAPDIGSWELAIDGDDVFLANAAFDEIQRVSLSGAGVPVTVAAANEPWGIAVDATHVYYANESTDGSIARAPRTGGTMEVLAPSVLPVGIAVDATAVYWTTLGGDVLRLAK